MHISGPPNSASKSGIWGPNKKATNFIPDTGLTTEHQKRLKSHLSDIGDEVTESNKSKEAWRGIKKGHNLGHRIKDHPPQSNNSMKNPPSEKP
jgi:hypothetical protein